VSARIGTAEIHREEIAVLGPNGLSTGALPKAVQLESDKIGQMVDVEIKGVTDDGQVLLTRLARAPMPSGDPRLLRVRLEQRCVLADSRASGISSAPRCDAPLTCMGGRCADPTANAADLEPYGPDWPIAGPDICRPANPGPPEVMLGTGQTDYTSLPSGTTLQMELGPQGGHHVWIAARMKNLKQSGSTTTITARQPETGLDAPPTAFVFTFDRDEGGFCKLFGLRFQLDAGAVNLGEDYKKWLGKDLDVTVEVRDLTGKSGKATTRIHIADKVLCPDGTTGTCT